MEEISLKDLIKILLSGYKLILIITVLTAVVSVLVWLNIPKAFVSEVALKVDTIDINQSLSQSLNQPQSTSSNATASKDAESLVSDISAIAKFPIMDINTYKQQMKSNVILERAIATLNLRDKDGVPLEPAAIKGRITVTSDDKASIIFVNVSDKTAQGAADLANAVVDGFIAELDAIIQNRCNSTLDNVEQQLAVQEQRLDTEAANLKEYSEAPINALVINSSIESLITQITQYKADLNDIQRKLDSNKIALSSLSEASGTYTASSFRLNTPYSSTDSSNAVSTIEMDLNGDIGSAVKALKKAELETEIIQSESEFESLTAIITTMENDLSHLQAIAAEEQQKYSILNMNYTLASEVYSKYQKVYHQIPVIASSGIADKNIMILTEATPPNGSANTSLSLYLAIGAVLGLFVGVFCTLFKSYWEAA